MKSAKDILKAMHEKLIADYPKENWERWEAIESSPYLSYYIQAMEEYAQQSQPSGMRWVREKPANDREFVLVTASLINGEWHYHGWEIIEVPDGYFALCELHGEEWGPYEDLSAEYYLVLSPVSESSPAGADEVKNSTGFVSVIQNGVANFYPAGAAEGASEGMTEAWVIEYDNDTGSGDEYFVEWFNVTNGEKSFRCNSKEDAEFLLASLSPGVEDNQTKKQ